MRVALPQPTHARSPGRTAPAYSPGAGADAAGARPTVMSQSVPPALATAMIEQLPALRRYARALCGDAALADDLVQDGIERALQRAATLQQHGAVGAWMRSIVHNLYLDEVRRRKVRGVPVDLEDMQDHSALRYDPHPSAGLRDVSRALQQLSAEHRQVLVLAGVEELSYREMADELGVPIGTVMSRLARARAALRAVLEPPARADAARPPP